jgi:predicted dehydrogenase
MALRIAIVGCGLIGQKRARAMGQSTRLVAVADARRDRAQALAGQYPGCEVELDALSCVRRRDIDAVVISTTNDGLASLTLAAVQAGKHVLVEKPAARNATELGPVISATHKAGVVVKVGFNHRFHPALSKAHALVEEGAIGPLLYVRGRYGHGGRLGYDSEWRANPTIAGGGELLDQGVHLLDLTRWFLGNLVEVRGLASTFFWKMPVEDNGFVFARTRSGQVAWLHASCTEWKNLFSFEIFGRDGKLQIDGLGGSYGVERLSFYRMLPQMGPPETTIWEHPGEDRSWHDEFSYFESCIIARKEQWPHGNLEDAQAALEAVGAVYSQSSSLPPLCQTPSAA